MKITTPHGDFNCRDMSFADRRKLHRLEVKAVSLNGDFEQEKFFDILEFVMDFAFEDPEKHLKELDDNQVDEILTAIYQSYKGISKKKK
jgi:hypothetical protein